MAEGGRELIRRLVETATRTLFLRTFLRNLVTGYAVAAVLVFVSAFLLIPNSVEWFLLLLLVVTAVDVAVSATVAAKKTTRASASMALDERFGLKERITTAFWLLGREEATAVDEFVVRDAARMAARIDPKLLRPKPVPRWAFALLWLYLGCPLTFLSSDATSHYTAKMRLLISVSEQLHDTLRDAPEKLRKQAERSRRAAREGRGEDAERLILDLKKSLKERMDEIEHTEHILDSSPEIRRLMDSLAAGEESFRSAAEGAGDAGAADEFEDAARQVEVDRTLRRLLRKAASALRGRRFDRLKKILRRIEEYIRTARLNMRSVDRLLGTGTGMPVASSEEKKLPQTEENSSFGGELTEQQKSALPADAEFYPEDMRDIIRAYFMSRECPR